MLPQYHHSSQHKAFQHATRSSATIPLNQVTGYAQVANFIATDKELAVYRRFDKTAAQVLLQLQSKVLALQGKLDSIDRDDALDIDEKRQLASATILEELPQNIQCARDNERQEIYSELRPTLKEYCKSKLEVQISYANLI